MIEEYCRTICSMRHIVACIMLHVVGECFIRSSQQNSCLGIFVYRNVERAIGRALCQVVWSAREVAIYMTSLVKPICQDGHIGMSLMSK